MTKPEAPEKPEGGEEAQEAEPTKEEQESEKDKKESAGEPQESVFSKISYTISSACDKINKVRSTLDNDIFRRAYAKVKRELTAVVRMLLPKRVRGHVLAGTGDPYSMAQIMAVYGVLYPYIGKRVKLTPDFTRKIAGGDISIRGRIMLFRIVRAAVVLILNRDVRRTIRRFSSIMRKD